MVKIIPSKTNIVREALLFFVYFVIYLRWFLFTAGQFEICVNYVVVFLASQIPFHRLIVITFSLFLIISVFVYGTVEPNPA